MDLRELEKEQMRTDRPDFGPGDTVRVHVKVREGEKERIGVRGRGDGASGGGVRESFTVRKVSYSVGVERVFPVHSPNIDRIEVVRHAACGAPAYYLRTLKGKAARPEEYERQ
jgi:large subunit ribosomal protein L19